MLPCDRPFQPLNTRMKPIGAYAQQKCEVEGFLEMLGGNYAIIRLSKVLSGDDKLIRDWIKLIKKGETISPFQDLVMCPISLAYTTRVIFEIALSSFNGRYHVSGEKEINYYDFAKLIMQHHFNTNNYSLIKPISAKTKKNNSFFSSASKFGCFACLRILA